MLWEDEMDLITRQYEVQRTGEEEFILVPGDMFKMETILAAGGGDEKLTYTAPAGKDHVRIHVKIMIDEEMGEEEP